MEWEFAAVEGKGVQSYRGQNAHGKFGSYICLHFSKLALRVQNEGKVINRR